VSQTTTRSRPTPGRPPGTETEVDPRISARRTEVTRQQGRRRLRVVGALVVAALLAFGAWSLLHSPLFSARSVTVVGATHETTAQIEAAAGLSDHPPLLDVNTAAAERDLDRLPWVRAALVSVHWPDGVRVAVAEQVAKLAMPVAGGRWAELAGNGRVLAVVATRPPGLMELTGPRPPGAPGGTAWRVGPAGARGGCHPAACRFGPRSPRSTWSPAASGAWVQLTMTTPILVNIGNASQLTAKYEDVTTMLANVTLHNGDIIDVSVPGAHRR
jgi:hypothetical protein